MGFTFGGLAIMSARPLAQNSLQSIAASVEVRSMFFTSVVFVVLLVLAYLTNPSETSFRAFLTEQSFRQHLSRLDDAQDDHNSDPHNFYPLSSRGLSAPKLRRVDSSTPFHFTNRASVSVRTPKHLFRSFGVFTIAAVVPSPRHPSCTASPCPTTHLLHITDSWFIGAFGRWWWGAPIDGLWKHSIPTPKDEEGARSGILDIKSLDRPQSYPRLPLVNNHPTPKLRSRDRSAQGPRSSTPPPLPKSASLPLHSKRLPPATPDHKLNGHSQPAVPTPHDQQSRVVSPSLSRSPSTLFDQSPAIAEVLRQLDASESTILDLRNQLSDFQATSAAARGLLQHELDAQRERKRQDDASRAELKGRTKNLEDSKRHAEGTRRESEKRLRAAQGAQSRASTRIERLGREISDLQQRIVDDGARVVNSSAEAAALEEEVSGEVEKRKKEIKVAEDVIAELGLRARELEERIAAETARLQKAQDEAEMRRQDRSFFPLHVITHNVNPWQPISQVPYGPPEQQHTYPERPTDLEPSDERMSETSPSSYTSPEANLNHLGPRSKGYSIFDEDIAASLSQHGNHPAFAPFADTDGRLHGLSPTSSSLIPSSLIQSLEIEQQAASGVPRSFQSEQDDILDREWLLKNKTSALPGNGSHAIERPTPGSQSPVSPTASLTANDYDPFEVRPHLRERMSFSRMDMQRATLPPRPILDQQAPASTALDDLAAAPNTSAEAAKTRRWFSKEKKGLNPDAKEFSLSKDKERTVSFIAPRPRPRPTLASAASSFSGGSFFTSSRAFAPSPAEREALTRALGGSSNTSLERLPSLSDVGSLPASPNHVHAVAHPHNHNHNNNGHALGHAGKMATNGPQPWAHLAEGAAVPRIKTAFSPFGDEEPQGVTGGVGGGGGADDGEGEDV